MLGGEADMLSSGNYSGLLMTAVAFPNSFSVEPSRLETATICHGCLTSSSCFFAPQFAVKCPLRL